MASAGLRPGSVPGPAGGHCRSWYCSGRRKLCVRLARRKQQWSSGTIQQRHVYVSKKSSAMVYWHCCAVSRPQQKGYQMRDAAIKLPRIRPTSYQGPDTVCVLHLGSKNVNLSCMCLLFRPLNSNDCRRQTCKRRNYLQLPQMNEWSSASC